MQSNFISIGYGSAVSMEKIVCVLSSSSLPAKRIKNEAQKRGKLIDATQGRKKRSLLVTTSDHVILSALAVETLASHLSQSPKGATFEG
jgi:regulator of extracellular matrix RemA (YlzA/DUF370 family)